MRYRMSMLDNLHYIQNNGEKAFLANQNKKYACPECNKPRTVHYIIVFIANRRKDRMK